MSPEMMEGVHFRGNRNRAGTLNILCIKSELLHKPFTRYPHAGKTEKTKIRVSATRAALGFRADFGRFPVASIDSSPVEVYQLFRSAA